jgi:hypothetical protein
MVKVTFAAYDPVAYAGSSVNVNVRFTELGL